MARPPLSDLLFRLNTMPLPTDPEASDFARTVIEALESVEFHKADHNQPVSADAPARPESLREYFAGQYLAGMAEHVIAGEEKRFCARAYEMADAMLAERSIKKPYRPPAIRSFKKE